MHRIALAWLVSFVLFCSLGSSSHAQETERYDLFARTNLVAWCIVPFDAQKRGPEERAAMLDKLGLRKYAYDYRDEHIPTFDAEMEAIKKRGVELTAWWFPGTLDGTARRILEVIQRHKVSPQLWITGGGEPTKTAAEQAERVAREAARIRPIAEEAARLGCKVALYNHGNWFGEPENQIAIIKHLQANHGITNVGIVYNQHHGHSHVERFAQLLAVMKPHLLALNLNGMTANGDQVGKKIMPIGQGELDVELVKVIRDSGWRGPIGILNHTDEDAETRLRDNLQGLEWVLATIDGKSLSKPRPHSWRDPSASENAIGVPSINESFGRALSGGLLLPGADA